MVLTLTKLLKLFQMGFPFGGFFDQIENFLDAAESIGEQLIIFNWITDSQV